MIVCKFFSNVGYYLFDLRVLKKAKKNMFLKQRHLIQIVFVVKDVDNGKKPCGIFV